MTLYADLAGLCAEFGLAADLRAAAADEHVRAVLYRRLAAAAAAAPDGARDRALVAAVRRDPVGTVARSAVVELVDRTAEAAAEAAGLRAWAAEALADTSDDFVEQRVRDWLFRLGLRDGEVAADAESLAGVTRWMQRRLAEESVSPPVLAALAAHGVTRKVRAIAANRARSRAVTRAAEPSSWGHDAVHE